MEELIPICVDTVKIHTKLSEKVRTNVEYFNIVVLNCPPYIPNPEVKNGYIRAYPIKRFAIPAERTWLWPDHPKDVRGDHTGAIIILKSLDNKILLLRNGSLWGLPKGVRNYKMFHTLKERSNESYIKNSIMPKTDCIVFTEDEVESAEENIYRETLEETGIMIDVNKLVQVGPMDAAYTRFIYQLDFNAFEHFKHILENGTDHENDEMRWITPEELTQSLILHRSTRHSKVFNHVTYLFISDRFPLTL